MYQGIFTVNLDNHFLDEQLKHDSETPTMTSRELFIYF